MNFIKLSLVICLSTVFISCGEKEVDHNSTIEVLKEFSDLEALIEADKDKLVVVNFWASTCAPCIKEMPHFNKLYADYGDKDLKLLLITTDRLKDFESRVVPFVSKHRIIPEVALLEDQNYSAWTEKIDSSWYGALPATAMMKGDRKSFRFGMYETYEDLQNEVDQMLK